MPQPGHTTWAEQWVGHWASDRNHKLQNIRVLSGNKSSSPGNNTFDTWLGYTTGSSKGNDSQEGRSSGDQQTSLKAQALETFLLLSTMLGWLQQSPWVLWRKGPGEFEGEPNKARQTDPWWWLSTLFKGILDSGHVARSPWGTCFALSSAQVCLNPPHFFQLQKHMEKGEKGFSAS